jgi:uncharacterized protein
MDLEKVQVDIVGLTTSPASGGAYALLLKEVEGTRQLPIIIGAYEAQSIALEMEGIKPPRPLTHDLLKNVIDAMGFAVLEVTISELKEGTFYATIILDEQPIDARPSDAIALAVRCGIPVYVAEKVMQEAAFIPESEEEKKYLSTSKDISTSIGKRLDLLQKQLKDAIEREDYEIAARLRDEIKKLEITDI